MVLNRVTSIFTVLLIANILFATSTLLADDVVLKNTRDWTIDTIAPGIIRYNYATYYEAQNAHQIVNVLEIDYTNPSYNIEVKYVSPADSLSSVAKKADAIAGINGSYELDATFVKSNNQINSQVTLPEGHLRFWKHEGAFFFNGDTKEAAVSYGTNDSYLNSVFPNILSGAPMLINNYDPVGETFVGDVAGIDLNSLEYEDYRRHQGVRHPRTVVALTESNKLLLIVVDGRRTGISEGMSAKELTQFLTYYFNPKSALNIDGGGSTTMYIKGSNESNTDVINYPTDNGKFDHYGQRSVQTFILVKTVGGDNPFAGGSGTVLDPYIITNANQLNNIRKTDWASAVKNKPYFKLESDIDLSGSEWSPINNTEPYAQLHFDGNGNIIKNMSVKGMSYASLFGVLCGSCKNLGVINADVASINGGGIIAGYVGVKTPSNSAYTGIIENCYTTGKVSGSDAVGGIVGNIGKPDAITNTISGVKNCYSTATVTALNTTNNSRAGGIAGIVFDKGMLENSYATGTVISSMYGAGGVVGWSDVSLKGLVALNEEIANATAGNIGRIAAFMGEVGGVQAQGVNCWGYDGITLNNAGNIISQTDLKEGEITICNASYDGISRTLGYLSVPVNYALVLGWNFAGENNIWAQTMSNNKPIFQWQYNRGDYAAIDGHGVQTGVESQCESSIQVFVVDDHLFIKGINDVEKITVYTSSGQLVVQKKGTQEVNLTEKGLYILVIETPNNIISRKLACY